MRGFSETIAGHAGSETSVNEMTVKSKSNAQRAADALRKLIFSGELAPGTDHLETELAERLGMSRTPVREAVMVLKGQGLLEVRPRKGVRIMPVSPEDMREIYEILNELETMAAGQAASLGYSESEFSELVSTINDMEAALASGDRAAWAAGDERFHRELVRLGGNRRVMEICDRLSDQVRRARQMTLFLRPEPTRSNEEHRVVCEAIMAGDAELARDAHRRHREHALEVIVELLKGLGQNKR